MIAIVKKYLSNAFVIFWIAVALNVFFSVASFIYLDCFFPVLKSSLAKIDHHYLYAIIAQSVLLIWTVDCFSQASYQKFNRSHADRSVPRVIRQITRVLIWVIGAFACYVVIYKVSLNAILATSGGLGVGVFYMFRERVSDFSSGISLQTEGLVSNGDWIYISNRDITGRFQVVDIDQKYVTLKLLDDQLIRKISNRIFINLPYYNYTKQAFPNQDRRKMAIELRVENDSDKVISVINTALQYVISTNKEFYDLYDVGVADFSNGYITYQIRYFCNVSLSMRSSENAIMGVLKRFLGAASIDMSSALIPIPIDLDILNNTTRLINVYKLSILKALSREEVIFLSKKINTIYIPPKDHFIKKGDLADSMYIISEGSLEVSIINSEGQAIIVATLWPGQCVGEMSLLTGAPRSADVYCKSAATLLEIKKEVLAPILLNNPELINRISEDLTEKLAQNTKLANQKLQNENNLEASKGLASKILSFFFK